jgi:SET family sugar efflux transporter-like MFS transporter
MEQTRRRLYLIIWLLLFAMGLLTGAITPYIGPIAVQRFHASGLVVGTLFAATAAVSMVAGPLTGLITDRMGSRKRMIVGGTVVVALGMLALSQANSAPAMLAALVCIAVGGVGMPLLFAVVGDVSWMFDAGEPRSGVTTTVRMGYALGFALGAPLGGVIAQSWGYATVALLVTAGELGLAVAVGFSLPALRPAAHDHAIPTDRVRGLSISLWLFCAAAVLVMMAEQAKLQFFPLRVTQELGMPPGTVGVIFGVQATLELGILPLAGWLADRAGLVPLLLITCLAPVPYVFGLSTATQLPVLLGLQVLGATAVAGYSGLAYVQVQRLAPGREGFALTLYSSGFAAATLATGLLIGGAVQLVGVSGGLRTATLPAFAGWVLMVLVLARRGRGWGLVPPCAPRTP